MSQLDEVNSLLANIKVLADLFADRGDSTTLHHLTLALYETHDHFSMLIKLYD